MDNAVFRLGLTPSRGSARQLIVHGHIAVNKRKVRSPGFVVGVGDIISLAVGSESITALEKRKEMLKKYEPPAWLVLERDKLEGRVLSSPESDAVPFEANLVVESFSK